MEVKETDNVFDVLAFLCSFFTKEKERECALRWTTATEENISMVINKYKNIFAAVLNASAREYKFNMDEIQCLNDFLQRISREYDEQQLDYDEIYLLIIQVEHYIDSYSDWQGRGVVFKMEPLNANCNETQVSIYPYYQPMWDTVKSERRRDNTFNARFINYMIIRKGDASPFEIVMHYWNDQGLLQKDEDGWNLRVAMSPVMDSARLSVGENTDKYGKSLSVHGIENEEEVMRRIIRIFDFIFGKQYGIIMFPEVLGSEKVVDAIKERMRLHPEYCTYVLLPTICQEEENVLVVLGPGGIEVLRKSKGTAFVLEDNGGERKREQLHYTNKMDLMITKEMGIIAFPICAELLEPLYYSKMIEVGRADVVLWPSFSPGYQAIERTMRKGNAALVSYMWINTCSAKGVSRNGRVPEVLGAIQLPDMNDESFFQRLIPDCDFKCSEELCYFDIVIGYHKQKFSIQFQHCVCA